MGEIAGYHGIITAPALADGDIIPSFRVSAFAFLDVPGDGLNLLAGLLSVFGKAGQVFFQAHRPGRANPVVFTTPGRHAQPAVLGYDHCYGYLLLNDLAVSILLSALEGDWHRLGRRYKGVDVETGAVEDE
ncbi:hypothetical protein ES705_42172 [subsurface metagenome]